MNGNLKKSNVSNLRNNGRQQSTANGRVQHTANGRNNASTNVGISKPAIRNSQQPLQMSMPMGMEEISSNLLGMEMEEIKRIM